MLNFISNRSDLSRDLYDVINLFKNDFLGAAEITFDDSKQCHEVTVNGKIYKFSAQPSPILCVNKKAKSYLRQCKVSIYKALSDYCGKKYPWGSLTGIRPTKIAYELIEGGYSDSLIDSLQEAYLVSRKKAQLIKEITDNQKGYSLSGEDKVNLYVHIPFCTSKCNYCSFPSYVCDKVKDKIDLYVDVLIKEIRLTAELIEKNGYKVFSVYIGGGTPTSLSAVQLQKVLEAIPYKKLEYTLEAGRPDTITDEKLDIALRQNINRISVNPQTFCDHTLKLIGRNHTSLEIEQAYAAALKRKFIVNMDLIAGLTGEKLSDFQYSLNKVIEMNPHNITVHTLSRKNGSQIKNEGIKSGENAEDMVEYAIAALKKANYLPYYLYRQKNMLENLENIGFSQSGYPCVNNITTMEESLSIIGCGLGAISKRVFEKENRIERLANVRELDLYFSQFDDRMKKKELFFQK